MAKKVKKPSNKFFNWKRIIEDLKQDKQKISATK